MSLMVFLVIITVAVVTSYSISADGIIIHNRSSESKAPEMNK